jgi:hypothetical protein
MTGGQRAWRKWKPAHRRGGMDFRHLKCAPDAGCSGTVRLLEGVQHPRNLHPADARAETGDSRKALDSDGKMMAGKIKTREDCRFPALSSAILNAIGPQSDHRTGLARASANRSLEAGVCSLRHTSATAASASAGRTAATAGDNSVPHSVLAGCTPSSTTSGV